LRWTLSFLLALSPAVAAPQQQEIQRALIQRDQQSSEFAAQLRGGVEARKQLELLHAQQLREARQPLSVSPDVARELLPYQRERMGDERVPYVLRLRPPEVRAQRPPTLAAPLPLPGGMRPGVEPIEAPSVGG